MKFKIITNPPYLQNLFIDIYRIAVKYLEDNNGEMISINPYNKFVDFNIKSVYPIDYKQSLNMFEYRNPLDICIFEIVNYKVDYMDNHYLLLPNIALKVLKNIKVFKTFSQVMKREVPLKDYCIVYSYIGGLAKSQNFIYKDNISLLNRKTYRENIKNQHKKDYPKTHFSFKNLKQAEEFLKYLNSKIFLYIEYITRKGHYVSIQDLPYFEFEEFDENKIMDLLNLNEEEKQEIRNVQIPRFKT